MITFVYQFFIFSITVQLRVTGKKSTPKVCTASSTVAKFIITNSHLLNILRIMESSITIPRVKIVSKIESCHSDQRTEHKLETEVDMITV